MNMNKELDIWDSLMIRHIKSFDPRFNILKKIYAKRCGIETKYVDKECIIGYLLRMIEELNLVTLGKFADMLRHDKYVCLSGAGEHDAVMSHQDKLLNICCQIFRYTEVSKLPNFRVSSKFLK